MENVLIPFCRVFVFEYREVNTIKTSKEEFVLIPFCRVFVFEFENFTLDSFGNIVS